MNEMLRYKPIITSETQIYQEPQKSKTAFIHSGAPASTDYILETSSSSHTILGEFERFVYYADG